MALAFVPQADVISLFNACLSQLNEPHTMLLHRFIDYFSDTWLDGMFPIKMWNKYGQDFLHRTNNRVESWHSTLKQKLPMYPNIFMLINALKMMECGTELTLLKADAGESPPRRRIKYVKLEEKLKRANDLHKNGSISVMDLLKRIRYSEI